MTETEIYGRVGFYWDFADGLGYLCCFDFVCSCILDVFFILE